MRADEQLNGQNYSFYKTAGGSMFPFIRWNEQIVVKKVDPQTLVIGDIILFVDKSGNKVAHRLVKITKQDGQISFQTKGDHNDNYDEPIKDDQIIGKVVILKRKNVLFAFSADGLERLRYQLSCFSVSVLRLVRRLARIIIECLQSSRLFRRIARSFLLDRVTIRTKELPKNKDEEHLEFTAILFGYKIGSGYLTFTRRGWWIWSVAVLTPFRRLGIAGKLCENQIDVAKRLGGKTIYLHVRKDNFSAVKCYSRLGFKTLAGSETGQGPSENHFVDMELKI